VKTGWWSSVVEALEWKSPADEVIDRGRAAFDTVARLSLATLRRRPSVLGEVVRAIPPAADHGLIRSPLAPLLIFNAIYPEDTAAALLNGWGRPPASVADATELSCQPHPVLELLRDDIGVEAEWLEPARAGVVMEKAKLAVSLIEATSPPCARLIRRCTHLVLFVRSPDPRVGSLSFCQFAGLSLIVNADEERVSPADVADRIIHESIHDLLYTGHFAEPLLAEPGGSDTASLKITSPWTGRPLTLRNYVHACFVWYALSRFWSLPSLAFAPAQAIRRRDIAVRGFQATSSVLDPLGPSAALLSPSLLEALDSLHGRASSIE
jgi:hypothetical protein